MKRFVPQKIKDLVKKLLESHSSTKDVADGLGIGVFVAFLPIIGIQMYVSLMLTRLFKKNTLVALIAAWISNPITMVPIYLFNLWVGNFLYPDAVSMTELQDVFLNFTWRTMLDAGADVLVPLWIGSVIVGLVLGVLSQQLCLRFYDKIRHRFKVKEKEGAHDKSLR